MFNPKPLTAVCVVVLALSALTSASASAATAGWMVNGTLLNGVAILSSSAPVDKNFKLRAAGVTIECIGKNLNTIEGTITSPAMGLIKTLEFTSCQSITENCILAGQPKAIITQPLLFEATLDGVLAFKATFAPETKTIIIRTLAYEGAECALKGNNAVTGKFTMLAPAGQSEKASQLINATTTEASGELKIGSSPASLEGAALLTLDSDDPWSFL